jgi:hypothetical protein
MDDRHLRRRKTKHLNQTTTPTMMRTELGNTILRILKETKSISSLVEYLRDNELFKNGEPIDQYKYGYLYKIGLEQWTKATGIDANTLPDRYWPDGSIPFTDDGLLWTDFDFEDDGNGNSYYEHDGTKYVYIALDNYTGQFDNDECVMAPACALSRSVSTA